MTENIFYTEKMGYKFIYDSANHALLDLEKKALNSLFDSHSIQLPQSSVTKSSSPKTVKFLLGHACNYSCGYCVQKDIGNSEEKIKNQKTALLIQNTRKNLKIESIERIELWGGETLLYWNDIISLMEEFDREGLVWYIPTNGTMLQSKHVQFFKSLKSKVTIGISHDGPAHEFLRGPNFLETKASILRELQEAKIDFSFNPVISMFNYDLFKVNDYFIGYLKKHGLKPVPLVFELGRVYDKTLSKNSSLHVIHGDALQKYEQILSDYLDQHRQKLFNPSAEIDLLPTNLFHFGNGVVPYAKTLQQQRPVSFKSNCGVDLDDLITIDINGQIRTCQNAGTDHIFGQLDKLAEAKNEKLDLSRSDNFCKGCSVLRLCKSSCPIDINFDVFYINHLVEKVHYTALQLCAFSVLFQDKVMKYEQ